jgi:hypothetical protein
MGTNNALLHVIQMANKLKQENANIRQQLQLSNNRACESEQENANLRWQLQSTNNMAIRANELEQENTNLKGELQRSNNMRHEIMKNVKDLEEKHAAAGQEIKRLTNRITNLKRRVCDHDCFSCAIVNVLENDELGLRRKICCPQLRTIIIWYAQTRMELKHLKCRQFADILHKCEILTKQCEYKYSQEINDRRNEMAETFTKLMRMDPGLGVVIIARVFSMANEQVQGHAELCYLNSRTQDGKVTILDPQMEWSGQANQQDFIDHIRNDEGLIFYTLNLKTLKGLINDNLTLIHLKTSDETLGTSTGDMDGNT